MTKNIDDVLAAEAVVAEDYELPEIPPEGVQVNRPQAGRLAVVSVRLSPSELEQLKHAAEEAQLPVWPIPAFSYTQSGVFVHPEMRR